ncbi:MAG: AbrB family transcriptional regulator [Defluviicoccus sp.]|nr:AbrB family transcriptional regulator [Defluviicoccus sp.]MDE0275696.1 AbrB family transcriptional regulator [Defluviicoccus sp.]
MVSTAIRSIYTNGLSLGAAVAGGFVFSALDTPIPWLLGPLAFVAGINLAGFRIGCPNGTRQVGQIVIGTAIGLRFTPDVATIVLGQLHWMAVAAAVAVVLGGIGALIQIRIARLDPATAYFGNVPGGMAEMLTLGDRFRAEPVAVALSQTVRVGIVVVTVPVGLTWLGTTGGDLFSLRSIPVDWSLLPILVAGCTGSAFLLNRLGVINAWMLGAVGFAGLLTATEIELSGLPDTFLILGQLLIGAALGERFDREPMRRAPRVIVGAVLSTIMLLIAGIVLAAAIGAVSGIPLTTMVAATCPGGLAEMSITAEILGLGVPLVTAYHITRIVLITLVTLPLFRMIQRRPAA